MQDLGSIYASARQFAPLASEAEHTLLPELQRLGAELRTIARAGKDLRKPETEALPLYAERIRALLATWRERLEQQRRTPAYLAALAAIQAEDWERLQLLLPQIFAHATPAMPNAVAYVPIEVHREPRRGLKPFLSAQEAAAKIARVVSEGVEPDRGPEPWEADFPSIEAASNPDALATPIWLEAPVSSLRAAVLGDERDPSRLRIFCSRLQAPWAVGVAEVCHDESWLAQERSFADYRKELLQQLAALGIATAPRFGS